MDTNKVDESATFDKNYAHIIFYYMLVRVWGLGIQNKVDESERLRRWRKCSYALHKFIFMRYISTGSIVKRCIYVVMLYISSYLCAT